MQSPVGVTVDGQTVWVADYGPKVSAFSPLQHSQNRQPNLTSGVTTFTLKGGTMTTVPLHLIGFGVTHERVNLVSSISGDACDLARFPAVQLRVYL